MHITWCKCIVGSLTSYFTHTQNNPCGNLTMSSVIGPNFITFHLRTASITDSALSYCLQNIHNNNNIMYSFLNFQTCKTTDTNGTAKKILNIFKYNHL